MAIKRWISRFTKKRKSAHPVKAAGPHRLTDVAAQLDAWSHQRMMIWVRPPFEKRYYQSMVLDVDLPSELFLIDELFPYEGSPQYLLNQQLSVEVRGEAQHASFKTLCTNVRMPLEQGDASGLAHSPLVLRLPEVISRHQRRAAFRVNLNHVQEAFATLALPDPMGERMFPLLDISSVGMALSVPAPLAESFPTRIEKGLITVMDVMFEVNLSKRRIGVLPDGRYLVGLAFCDLSPAQRAKLERWILQLQRALRRKPRDQDAA